MQEVDSDEFVRLEVFEPERRAGASQIPSSKIAFALVWCAVKKRSQAVTNSACFASLRRLPFFGTRVLQG